MPSLSAYNIIRIYSNKGRRLWNRKQNTCWHRNTSVKNGGSQDCNFISLLNSAVDKNWVCRHCLLQFILGKWCRKWCSNLRKLFVNSKFTKCFPLFCTNRPFHYFCLLTLQPVSYDQVTPSFWLSMCVNLRLSCMHFHATDAQYVMFRVSWCKSLKVKGSTTPDHSWQMSNPFPLPPPPPHLFSSLVLLKMKIKNSLNQFHFKLLSSHWGDSQKFMGHFKCHFGS